MPVGMTTSDFMPESLPARVESPLVGLRVINQMGAGVAEHLQRAQPDIELIEFTGGDPPPGLAADVFFGGYFAWDEIARWIDAAGVRWVQVSGTGVDKVPRSIYDGRIVTCARRERGAHLGVGDGGRARVGQAHARDELHEPPRHWNFPWPARRGGGKHARARRARRYRHRDRAARSRSTCGCARCAAPTRRARSRVCEVVRELDELVADADHLVLAAPATAKTRHLVNAALLERVKPGVHLVNIARGTLVDQDALRVALDDGRVAMASLDTVDPEPLPEGPLDVLASEGAAVCAHLVVQPDSAGRGDRDLPRQHRTVHAGEPLREVVDPDEGY